VKNFPNFLCITDNRHRYDVLGYSGKFPARKPDDWPDLLFVGEPLINQKQPTFPRALIGNPVIHCFLQRLRRSIELQLDHGDR
jgi:hypothetical protein